MWIKIEIHLFVIPGCSGRSKIKKRSILEHFLRFRCDTSELFDA